jgi:hypothetical protein
VVELALRDLAQLGVKRGEKRALRRIALSGFIVFGRGAQVLSSGACAGATGAIVQAAKRARHAFVSI